MSEGASLAGANPFGLIMLILIVGLAIAILGGVAILLTFLLFLMLVFFLPFILMAIGFWIWYTKGKIGLGILFIVSGIIVFFVMGTQVTLA